LLRPFFVVGEVVQHVLCFIELRRFLGGGRRWLVAYRGVEFYVHLDRLLKPAHDGYFIEVKSRTWSRRDARDKAAVITDLLARLGASPDDTLSDGYADLAAG